MKFLPHVVCAVGLLLCAGASHAQRNVPQVCEVNGEQVSPYHGGTTAGKTGIMRCTEAESKLPLREWELRNGAFIGIRRSYENGLLKQDYSVNERSNRDGVYREYAGKSVPNNPLLREINYRNGKTVGLSRSWYASGQLRGVTFFDDESREQASVDFTPKGQLRNLRCADRPLLAPHADDGEWCGHKGSLSNVVFHGDDGRVLGTSRYEFGERRKHEILWGNGKPNLQVETTPAGGNERRFDANGVMRREVAWVVRGSGKGNRRQVLFDHEYHENGKLMRERRYTPGEQPDLLQLETLWYLNGLPRSKLETVSLDGLRGERETRFHDNGQMAFEGVYVREGRDRRIPFGVHKNFDDAGRLRSERHHDARGRVSREREFDESGQPTRDFELFEDGSRKPRVQ